MSTSSTAPSLPEEQLLELLLQLKKTTPDQARTILNSQPHVAYALITIMVSINAVNVDVLQKTVASFSTAPSAVAAPLAPIQQSIPQLTHLPNSTLPPPSHYLQTPQSSAAISITYSTHANGGGLAPPSQMAPANHLSNQPTTQALLANISEDQRAMIMRVITMTSEDLNRLQPADRASMMHLRASLGLPPS